MVILINLTNKEKLLWIKLQNVIQNRLLIIIILLKIKTELNKSEDEYKNAKEALNNAIYLENAPDYDIYETQTFSYIPTKQTAIKNIAYVKHTNIKNDDTIFSYPKFSYNTAVEKAYKNSPDIKALAATRNSFEQALIMVKRNYYPEINAGAGYDFIKTKDYSNNAISVAVTVDSTINAMHQKYDIKSAIFTLITPSLSCKRTSDVNKYLGYIFFIS